MGITGQIFHGFTFDGEDSKDYGVYITGSGVFSSPERDVEMISIPGRDGAYALDKGRFSNIEVVYPAGLFGVDKADFAQAISDFRNMLGSRKGYCRLEDDYNPGEYREAVFKAGLEVNPASLDSGEFDIVFECKPQRWLTSGETAVALSSGDDITNPTLFDSKPQLQVWGYGDMAIANDTIHIESAAVGWITVGGSANGNMSLTTIIDGDLLNNNDPIALYGAKIQCYFYPGGDSVNSVSKSIPPSLTAVGSASGLSYDVGFTFSFFDGLVFNKGTARTISDNITLTVNLMGGGSKTVVVGISLAYDGDSTFTISQSNITVPTGYTRYSDTVRVNSITGDSSQSALGSPIYIDLDIGEAYKIENGVAVDVNNAVSIPAILPTLPPGATTITFDNTITQLKVVPRWWRL